MAQVGRNDRCPCGSGRKFKNCCGAGGATTAWSSRAMLAIVAAMLFAALYAGFTAMTSETSYAGPGPGRVWSPEHGHYH